MHNDLMELPRLLLPWFRENARDLPWRRDREPYHVWLSEIMLQQTRVEAVRGYYLRFLEELPDVQSLADAPEEQLLKLWEGLGYYNRARNLQKAARMICTDLGGRFPDTYGEILRLPGVGEYTAGAVASICFDRKTAAVDGNVLRVLSRLEAYGEPADTPEVKKRAKAALEEIYPDGHPGAFTQALMELGATVCVPKGAPKCEGCPLSALCRARAQGNPEEYPKKSAKKPRKTEEKTVFLLRCGGLLALEKRPETGLLAGLWQLPNVPGTLDEQQALRQAADWGTQPRDLLSRKHRIHIFTHKTWEMEGYEIRCDHAHPDFCWAGEEELAGRYALPTAFRQFIEER